MLSAPFFDEEGAACAQWLSERYAGAALRLCVRLFTPPRRRAAHGARRATGYWRARGAGRRARWTTAGSCAGRRFGSFEPRKNAVKQASRCVAALRAGERARGRADRRGSAPWVLTARRRWTRQGRRVVVERRRQACAACDVPAASRCGPPAGGAALHARPPAAAPQLTGQASKRRVARHKRGAPGPQATGDVVLVDGVTGSGKTEVYLQAIEARAGRRAHAPCVLVPEISLTPQTVARFRGALRRRGGRACTRACGAGERYDQWDFIRSGAGARGGGRPQRAVHARCANVGLIVIDEEHEGSYKQDSRAALPRARRGRLDGRRGAERGARAGHAPRRPSRRCHCRAANREPRWHARGAARARERPARCPPWRWWTWRASSRAGVALHVLGDALARALGEELDAGAQGGAAAEPARLREVPAVPRLRLRARVPVSAPRRSRYHERGNLLRLPPLRLPRRRAAHVPRMRQPLPARSSARAPSAWRPSCARSWTRLPGVGPGVPIVRMDADTTRGKGAHQRLLEQFAAADAAGAARHADDRQGARLRRRHAGGRHQRRHACCSCPTTAPRERTFDARRAGGRAAPGAPSCRAACIVQTYEADAARHPRRRRLRPRAVPARRAAEAPAAGLPALRADGERAGVGQGRGRPCAARRPSSARGAGRPRCATSAADGWDVLPAAPCVLAKLRNTYRYHIVVKCAFGRRPVGARWCACSAPAKSNPAVNAAVDIDPVDLL